MAVQIIGKAVPSDLFARIEFFFDLCRDNWDNVRERFDDSYELCANDDAKPTYRRIFDAWLAYHEKVSTTDTPEKVLLPKVEDFLPVDALHITTVQSPRQFFDLSALLMTDDEMAACCRQNERHWMDNGIESQAEMANILHSLPGVYLARMDVGTVRGDDQWSPHNNAPYFSLNFHATEQGLGSILKLYKAVRILLQRHYPWQRPGIVGNWQLSFSMLDYVDREKAEALGLRGILMSERNTVSIATPLYTYEHADFIRRAVYTAAFYCKDIPEDQYTEIVRSVFLNERGETAVQH